MPRIARVVVSGIPHHITQRGNNRQDVFLDDQDRRVYLKFLRDQSRKYNLDILGYCLMSNHVHLIAVPRSPDSLARALGRTHFLYTQYANRRYKRSGHLWQNRFYSCALDESHLFKALIYVDRNPVRAKIARRAWAYQWSSASEHTRQSGSPPQPSNSDTSLINLRQWLKLAQGLDWKALLSEADDNAEADALRNQTRTGRPLGSETFIKTLEKKTGKRLHPLPEGRPCKNPTKGRN